MLSENAAAAAVTSFTKFLLQCFSHAELDYTVQRILYQYSGSKLRTIDDTKSTAFINACDRFQ
jgi:hypothetical protein